MKFKQEKELILSRAHEFIVVPFFEDTNIESQLQQIGLNGNNIGTILQKQKELVQQTILIPKEAGSIRVTFMNLGCEANYDYNHLIELFRCFGKQVEEDCQILLEEWFAWANSLFALFVMELYR